MSPLLNAPVGMAGPVGPAAEDFSSSPAGRPCLPPEQGAWWGWRALDREVGGERTALVSLGLFVLSPRLGFWRWARKLPRFW